MGKYSRARIAQSVAYLTCNQETPGFDPASGHGVNMKLILLGYPCNMPK